MHIFVTQDADDHSSKVRARISLRLSSIVPSVSYDSGTFCTLSVATCSSTCLQNGGTVR